MARLGKNLSVLHVTHLSIKEQEKMKDRLPTTKIRPRTDRSKGFFDN